MERNSRYLKIFFLIIFIFIGVTIYSKINIKDFRKEFINFNALNNNERILLNGLTREQIGQLKFSYLEKGGTIPDVGIFGNHQIQFWNESSFQQAGYKGKVFNFWFANLSITDLVYYISWLDKKKLLPKKAIIIQMTTPNNDNGEFIVSFSKDLPLYIIKETEINTEEYKTPSFDKIALYIRLGHTWIKKTFDYTTLLIGLLSRGESARVLNVSDCKSGEDIGILKHMPSIIIQHLAFLKKHKFCRKEDFKGSMRKDGSLDDTGYSNAATINENPLDNEKLVLKASDSKILNKELKLLITLAKKNNLKIVIVIPPVYETARVSTANNIVDKAMKNIPKDFFIDNRNLYTDRDYYINYDHPNKKYFNELSSEIMKKLP